MPSSFRFWWIEIYDLKIHFISDSQGDMDEYDPETGLRVSNNCYLPLKLQSKLHNLATHKLAFNSLRASTCNL